MGSETRINMKSVSGRLGFAQKVSMTEELDCSRMPPEELASKCSTEDVFPCEQDGPYVVESYHHNLCGIDMGFRSREAYDSWFEFNQEELTQYGSWDEIELAAVSTDWAMTYGAHALGVAFQGYKMKPILKSHRDAAVQIYDQCSVSIQSMHQETYDLVMNNPKY